MNGHWNRHDKAKVVIERGCRGGGGEKSEKRMKNPPLLNPGDK